MRSAVQTFHPLIQEFLSPLNNDFRASLSTGDNELLPSELENFDFLTTGPLASQMQIHEMEFGLLI